MTITQKLQQDGLKTYYNAGGTGLESKFLNWIVSALKPGGKAFMALPKSMLARTDTSFKAWIRERVTVDALIYLPERTFYTTSNPTYILAITKKQNTATQSDPVFCYYVREIGETRDVERSPAPNDLPLMVDEFSIFMANKPKYVPSTKFCRVIAPSEIAPEKRWDVDYLWSPQELSNLGVVDSNVRSIDGVVSELESVATELRDAQEYLEELLTEVGDYAEVSLASGEHFRILRGERVTKADCDKHPGDIPVVASGRHLVSHLGTISEAYAKKAGLPMFSAETSILSIGCTGAVGTVHLRNEPHWVLHDDALGVEVRDPTLLPGYVRFELQQVIDRARFDYTAKLYQERLRALVIRVPVHSDGRFDEALQKVIAAANDRKESAERLLRELAEHLRGVSLDFSPRTVAPTTASNPVD